MARTVRDAKLDTRGARAKLKARREPYWRSISEGCAVGYRKGAKGGTWIARHYSADRSVKARLYSALGVADDVMEPDGAGILSFDQAQARARTWFGEQARMAAGLAPSDAGPYTVGDAIRDYLTWFRRHRKSAANTETAINAHVLPALGAGEVRKLTTAAIREWHESLAATPARLRSGLGRPTKARGAREDTDTMRKRRATANRVLTILKAALNHAWREGKAATDEPWRRVRPFHDVESPVVRYLSAAECLRLVNATGPDFRPMVRAAILTGCRYGELIALHVADFNARAAILTVRASKSGKSRHVVLTDEAQQLFRAATAGKASHSLIVSRPDGTAWGKNHQQRPLAEACKRARVSPAVSFHVLRHTHGSLLAMEGVPLAVIAKQLGHSDTRMTEQALRTPFALVRRGHDPGLVPGPRHRGKRQPRAYSAA